MFPGADSNSFTVPYSDQFPLYSNLLDDSDVDDHFNYNPYSPFSFFDQNINHPLFFQSEEQQQGLQCGSLVKNHEAQQQPMLTAFEEFTMADHTSSNNSNSMVGLACDPANGISSSAVEHMKIDHKASKNVNLSKKDRHSKINTAQGPRDRRMRLSLDIAKRFFGLQDMLGFDKASKTVDWLLSKSQSEINKVAKNSKIHDGNVATKSDSFGACECYEEVSSEVVNKDDVSQSGEMDTNKVNKQSSSKKKIKSGKVSMSSQRNGFNSLSKESREKARARARERTKEKMMICTSRSHKKQDENVNHFSSMDVLNHVKNPDFRNLGSHAYLNVGQGHTPTNQDESLANTSYWNPSSCNFNSLPNQINETSHQLLFEDIQFYAKPWETYN